MKVRGFRIEVSEIEAALAQHPGVREAVVKAHETEAGEKYLAAYVVAAGETAPDVRELRAFIAAKLPSYMAPSWFTTLSALPLTPNGKVDRRVLAPSPELRGTAQAGFVAPRSLLEQTIADVWARVLRLERVGAFDNFFELGGHSLKATQVISQLREELGIEVPLRSLFKTPTVAELAIAVLKQMAEHVDERDLVAALSEAGEATAQPAVEGSPGEL